jgi:hypothetical protein
MPLYMLLGANGRQLKLFSVLDIVCGRYQFVGIPQIHRKIAGAHARHGNWPGVALLRVQVVLARFEWPGRSNQLPDGVSFMSHDRNQRIKRAQPVRLCCKNHAGN